MKKRTKKINKKDTDMLPKITTSNANDKKENSNKQTSNVSNEQNNLYPSDILGLFKRLGIE